MTDDSTSPLSAPTPFWLASHLLRSNANNNDAASKIDCICLGTGRFLRSVLVPALVLGAGKKPPVLIQPRGTSMADYMKTKEQQQKDKAHGAPPEYEIDTILPSGETETTTIPCSAVFSLATSQGKEALVEWLPRIMSGISLIGVGVTEAGLSGPNSPAMAQLFELLQLCHHWIEEEGVWVLEKNHKICVVDMDNVPNNGSVIQKHVLHLAAECSASSEMMTFLQQHVVFLNTMVDRITSHRKEDTMIPKCEPVPYKALVICDPQHDLPDSLYETSQTKRDDYGLHIRSTPEQLDMDVALKLRIANGTHTAMAHAMALCQLLQTDALSTHATAGPLLLAYLDALFYDQILPGATLTLEEDEAKATYDDWRRRLTHAHFGLSTFFITQNGPAKGGIRWGPTVVDLMTRSINTPSSTTECPVTVSMAFAYATLLRWLTPASFSLASSRTGIYTGWLQGASRSCEKTLEDESTITYADGLRYNLREGWYEFKCACTVQTLSNESRNLSDWLASLRNRQPAAYVPVIRAYLLSKEGGDLDALRFQPPISSVSSASALDQLASGVATLYARMVAGDDLMGLLQEMVDHKHGYISGLSTSASCLVEDQSSLNGVPKPLGYRLQHLPSESQLLSTPLDSETVASVVTSEVQSVIAVDLHTHLLPPSHGALCSWGIDELLTYHYLVSEYFITAPPSVTPESFFALSKKDQADMIWQALFVERSPISEACRGVVTTLVGLGLSQQVASRDLNGIRKFYSTFRDRGLEGTELFCETIFAKSGIEYAIMTNIPFDSNEARFWRPYRTDYSKRFRSALRVDPLLAGDRATVENALKASGYEVTLDGARKYLRDWCDTMKPEYMMASTPHDFVLPEGTIAGVKKTGVNADAMSQPFAFVDVTNADCAATCEDEAPSVIDESSDFLSQVLMKVCEELDLPIVLKIGAHRGVNKELKSAGDGVVAFADAGVLGRLCTRFPKVRFLATFLSRNNQHEACVLASKFRNLHIYGCWWFCNNPSIIQEITQMRVEMLGSAFTAQHSDARVVDQLLYKWSHSRAVIARVLAREYTKLIESGWAPSRDEVRRDVWRLFRGSFEEFMAKSLM